MKNIFTFFISLLLAYHANGQDTTSRIAGPRVGIDLSRLAIPLFENNRTGFEVVFDVQLKDRLYIAGEFGTQKVTDLSESNYVYDSKGWYMTLGVDRTIFELNPEGDNDYVYVGARYGLSSMKQSADFTIEDNFFSSISGSTSDQITTHWVQGLAGIKVELVKNLFVGVQAQLMLGIVIPKEDQVPLYINAGYGNGINKINVGFNYTVAYRLPFYKVRYPIVK